MVDQVKTKMNILYDKNFGASSIRRIAGSPIRPFADSVNKEQQSIIIYQKSKGISYD